MRVSRATVLARLWRDLVDEELGARERPEREDCHRAELWSVVMPRLEKASSTLKHLAKINRQVHIETYKKVIEVLLETVNAAECGGAADNEHFRFQDKLNDGSLTLTKTKVRRIHTFVQSSHCFFVIEMDVQSLEGAGERDPHQPRQSA
mmetsp:Transcript_16541/g.45050  ORF Transcript_16541/g.45050 Transcript_16541/m.45050 type:complete len:149 (-) Transcript_16541:121-567(-)